MQLKGHTSLLVALIPLCQPLTLLLPFRSSIDGKRTNVLLNHAIEGIVGNEWFRSRQRSAAYSTCRGHFLRKGL